MSSFLDALEAEILVADGGLGSMVHQATEGRLRSVDEVNLLDPGLVLDIHLRYLRAGARIIETNTFGANRLNLEAVGLADQTRQINERGAKLAREAREIAGVDVFIAGSIGPPRAALPPGLDAAERLQDVFREQVEALDARGVDLFVVETFSSVWEVEQAVAAIRSVSALPIVAQITLPAADEWHEGTSALPHDLHDRVARLQALDLCAFGTNCSLGPGEILGALEHMRSMAPDAHLAVMPNSGLPRFEAGRFIYPRATPEYYAWFAREAARLGARIIGGCCGTTPEQIAAIARAVQMLSPRAAAVQASEPPPPRQAEEGATLTQGSQLAQRFAAGEFVVSMQVDPPKGTETQRVIEACAAFRDSGIVHAADVNSNPMARLHMDALWMSLAIERLGLETIPHYTPRDASLMGIEGNLLGAWAAGIRNVLVITGDPSVVRGDPGQHDVYQTDAVGMVQHLTNLNRGVDCFGNQVGSPPAFHIGVAVNPNHEDLDLEVKRFRQKIDAGAHFAMTQVFFDWEDWERFCERLGGPPEIPVLVAVWPLTSHRLALRLHNEVPGIVVPERVLSLLDKAGPNARREGFALAREMLAEARRRAAGVYVIAPFKKPKAALELFD